MSGARTADVVVIGAGPAGAAAAYWLASHGHEVVVVERRTFPRSKGCGDIITPRAVRQLIDMGLGDDVDHWHPLDAIRTAFTDRRQLIEWPRHAGTARHGLVVRRRDLDETVAANAEQAGATLLLGHEAIEPVVDRGFVRGAVVRSPLGATSTIHAPLVVVADGANSTFGRSLGTFRTRGWPYAAAIRSYWDSPRHAERTMEMHFDITDRDGIALPGYGWVAPVGDGTVNIGVGVLSTARDFKSTNVAHLLDAFAARLADDWQIEPATATGVVRVGRIPMGGSVQPTAGPSFLVVGDAAATASPFSGAGIDVAYESGRLAADVVHDAITESGPTALQRYPKLLDERYGEQNKTGRLWARALARPAAMRRLGWLATRSPSSGEGVLRMMTGTLRPDHHVGIPETVSRLAATALRLAPDA